MGEIFSVFYSRKYFFDGKIRIQCQKIQTNGEFLLWTKHHRCCSLMKSENMTLLMCLVICNLIHPKVNKEASSIARLFTSASVCHIWHISSLFVNRKDWFRASPFNDRITVSWKLKPCHLSLSENRPCTIK